MSPAGVQVLLIDNEAFEGDLLRRRLASLEHVALRQALTLEAALDLMRAEPPDLVLLDYYLPPRHYEESHAVLRGAGYRGPVVLYTQLDAEAVQARGLSAAADAHLGKDAVSAESFGALLARVLGAGAKR